MARPRLARPTLRLAVMVTACALARPADAHAPPLGARVLARPDGSEEVIVTNRGLVFRDSNGTSSLLCNEALRISTAELPNVALLDDGGLLVATSSGLRLSRDRGCNWADVGGMETTNTPALASAPGDPSTVFVASYDPEHSGLLVTRDAGHTWASAVDTDASDYVHSLLVAGDDGSHVYATLTRYVTSEPPSHWLLRSLDGGRSWERRPLPLGDEDYAALAAGADPGDADRLVLYTVANSPGLDPARLLVSSDAGDSFEVGLERPEIRGASHDAEGRLWVAARDGLYRAEGDGFERVSAASELGCVGSLADDLLVCGHYAGVEAARSGVGVSRDGGQSFEPLLDFDRVGAPVACDAASLTATLCAQPWRDWEAELLGASPVGAPGAYGMPGAYGTPGAAPAATDTPVALDAATPQADPAELDTESATPGCGLLPERSSTRPALLGGVLALACGLCRRASGATARRGRAGREQRARG